MSEFLQVLGNIISQGVYAAWYEILSDLVGDFILVGIVVLVARIVIQRNHLDARRLRSNLGQLAAILAGWLTLGIYYTRGITGLGIGEVRLVAMTVVLVLAIGLGVLAAAGIKHYGPAPDAQFRIDIARFLICTAEAVADKKYYEDVHTSALKLVNTLDVIETAVSMKKSAPERGIG